MSSTTNAAIVQRVELLEKQVALLLKADVPVEAVPVARRSQPRRLKLLRRK